MPEIIVMSRRDAIKYSHMENMKSSIIISITDYNKSFPIIHKTTDNKILRILRLRFDDVTETDDNYTAINDEQAETIASFVKMNMNIERIIVHCEAGISRSAGCAAAIMKYLKNDDTPIFNNSYYKPNMTVYRKVINALITDI